MDHSLYQQTTPSQQYSRSPDVMMNIGMDVRTDKPLPLSIVQRAPYNEDLSTAFDLSEEFIYVIGQVKADFPSIGVRREFERCWLSMNDNTLFLPANFQPNAQPVWKQEDELDIIYQVLSLRHNRYLAREIKWTLINTYRLNGLNSPAFENDIFRLVPSEYNMSLLISSIAPQRKNQQQCKRQHQQHPQSQQQRQSVLLVGLSRVSPSAGLNELTIHKISPIQVDTLLDSVKQAARYSSSIDTERLKQIIAEVLALTDNQGDTDSDRAINYVLYHNPLIYLRTYDIYYTGCDRSSTEPRAGLTGLRTFQQRSGERHFIKVVFDYQNFHNGVSENWYATVDVTDEFPFLVSGFKRFVSSY